MRHTQRLVAGAALTVATLALSACGGGGSVGTTPASTAPSPSASQEQSGGTGLIADTERATVVAVCINLKEAEQIVASGIVLDQGRRAIVAAIGQLSKPPHPPAALRLAATLRQDVRRHHLEAAVNHGLAWCTQQNA